MKDRQLIGEIARKYIENLVLTSDALSPKWNCENVIFRKRPKWNYMDSCMMLALLMYADDSPEYVRYGLDFCRAYVAENGDIPSIEYTDFNLDNICGGRVLMALHRLTGEERFRLGCEKLYREQLAKQPRLDCGCFWHKAVYPHQMWLDGTFMALPFMAEYGLSTGDETIVNDAISQYMAVRDIMEEKWTGLYHHGFDETRTMYWADPETGLSREFWLRSNGWLCAGLADMYELTGAREIADMLSELLDALTDCLTAEKMLMQLPLRTELEGNYPETSGTLLYAYSALKSHRIGACGSSMADNGEAALMAVAERYIDNSGDIPVLKNICLMGGLGGENRRDGSAEYYLSEPVVENDAKGIAPFLMAAAEFR